MLTTISIFHSPWEHIFCLLKRSGTLLPHTAEKWVTEHTSYFWCKLLWETADVSVYWLVDRDEEENRVIWWIWKQRDPIGLACFLEHSPARTCGNRERGRAVAWMGMSDSRWFLHSLPRLINSNKRTSASWLCGFQKLNSYSRPGLSNQDCSMVFITEKQIYSAAQTETRKANMFVLKRTMTTHVNIVR